MPPNPKQTPYYLILGIAVVIHCGFVVVGLSNPLLDGHAFRQSQTALTVYWYLQEGWQLPPPLPLFGPPWSAPMEFPLFQTIVAGICQITGYPLEIVGRLVSLGFFYLSLPAMYLLGGRLGLASGQKLLLPAAALLTPVYAFYSRSFGIESTAFCFGIWFLWLADRCLDSPQRNWGTLSLFLALGVLTALTKITTLVTFAIPFGILLLRQLAQRNYARLIPVVGLSLVSLSVGYAWVAYGDAVKATNPFTTFLVSSEMRAWNFGKLGERIQFESWQTLLSTVSHVLLPGGNLLLIIVIGLTAPKETRRLVLILLLGLMASPLLFMNLYLVHDYYFYAPGIMGLAALVLCWRRLLQISSAQRWAGWTVLAISLGMQVLGYHQGLFKLQQRVDFEIPVESDLLRMSTHPDESVVIVGQDWHPLIPYYAQRKSIMLRMGPDTKIDELRAVLDRNEQPVGALLIADRPTDDLTQEQLWSKTLGLQSQPVLRAPGKRIFLSADRAQEIVHRIPDSAWGDFVYSEVMDSAVPGVTWQKLPVAEIGDQSVFSSMIPLPLEVHAPFGVSGVVIDGVTAFNAHAPTDVIFRQNAPDKTVQLEFGLLPDAYAAGNAGDGVVFRLDQIDSNGRRQILWARHLDPFQRPEDRGTQSASVNLPSAPGGQLVARVMTGEARNMQFDWAYWRKIEIR